MSADPDSTGSPDLQPDADPIGAYLDELADLLVGDARTTHRLLLEVEAHLIDERDARVARGENPASAAAEAVLRFGAAADVAREANRGIWRASRGAVLASVLGVGLRLAAVGLLLIGVAGGLTRVIASFGLMTAMYGLPADVVMPASSCAHWLAVQATAQTCRQAATLEASDDLTGVALVLGLGGLLLAVILLIAWRRRRRSAPSVLPAVLAPAIAAAMFGAAAVGLFILGATDAVISTTWGRGMWFTDGAAALAACAVSLLLLARAVRRGGRLISA